MKLIQKDGIDILFKNNKNTPRSAVCLYFSIDKPERYAGIYTLFSKLLLKGTKTRSAEDLADIIEGSGIEISVKCKQDYLKVSALFLNDDFNLAMEVLSDILQNSTFDEFEKEVFKSRGEIVSDLDSPQVKASDAFIDGIFEGHYYGNSYSKMLSDIDKIQKQDVVAVLSQIANSKKVISIAGDFSDMIDTVQAGNQLGDQCRRRRACDAPAKYQHKEQIQGDIRERGHYHGVQRRFSISKGAQDTGQQVIGHDDRDAQKHHS